MAFDALGQIGVTDPERALAMIVIGLAIYSIIAALYVPRAPGLGEREE